MKFYDIDKCKGVEYNEEAFLFEKDIKEVNVMDVFLIDGDYYTVGMCSVDKPRCAVHILDNFNTDMSVEEHDFSIVCPVCGYVDRDSWEMSEDYDDDYECGRCGARLQVQKNISVTYDAYIKELPSVKEVDDE